MYRDAAREPAGRFIAQRRIVEQAVGKIAGGEGILGLVGVAMVELRLIADRAVEQPGVEHRQAKMRGERPGDRALSRRGRTVDGDRSEEHTSELQSLMRISYAVFCLKKK